MAAAPATSCVSWRSLARGPTSPAATCRAACWTRSASAGRRSLGPAPALAAQDGAKTPFADRQFDVVTISAVLHHVPVEERQAVYRELGRVLKPGGRIYVFEHNPRNPLVRYVIARTPIDENAILLDAREVRHGLLDTARYELETDYLMFMPPGLAFLRTHRPHTGVAAPGGAICRGGAQRRLKEKQDGPTDLRGRARSATAMTSRPTPRRA